ncbi:cation:proton antiporter [Anaeromyxobacter sp. Fw109-5]|uniref:cation:proton antiporter domain-containing protein n=1 Tax=Anaeromyxobacter sp. (strain Fw109-5) TaxID=404589 RepID=UPI000158A895|nr:cation:proton antiporter [Anaeromyxobacter sp. Fw109-5]ABS28045.1 sodium/hydrogen exchanger [Anaeromyxobacter sp. Fw109-5]
MASALLVSAVAAAAERRPAAEIGPVEAARPEPVEGRAGVSAEGPTTPTPLPPATKDPDPAEDLAQDEATLGPQDADPVLPGPAPTRPPPRALPPIAPDPALAPVLESPGRPEAVAPPQRPAIVIRTIIGLALMLALAYAAAHPAVERFERRIGVSHLVTAGLPFIALGMLARSPPFGVLSDDVLAQLAPVLRLGLGWIGFIVGFRLDARQLSGTDERAVASAALLSSLPFAAVVAAAAAVLVPSGALADRFSDPVFLRDAIVLGTAASMTAATVPHLLPPGTQPAATAAVWRIVRLEEIAGILGLALVAAYFRPQGDAVTWRLPGTAWLMLTAGAGTLLGLVVLVLLRRARSGAEFSVLTLGSVAFSSGLAGYLHLSSVVVCFVAGVLLANFPGAHQARFRAVLDLLERPIHLVLLVILGALWPTRSVTGWLLIPVFVGARVLGRWVGARTAARIGALELDEPARRVVAAAPVGSLAIAIVVNAQLLYPGGSIADAVVAVVGGALVTEALVHAVRRRRFPPRPAPEPSP